MPLQKFLFNPGINKEGTDYTAEGGWFDGNLVRFRKGFPEKIGGDNLTIFRELFLFVVLFLQFFDCCFQRQNVCTAKV